jgi:hypothetical protein
LLGCSSDQEKSPTTRPTKRRSLKAQSSQFTARHASGKNSNSKTKPLVSTVALRSLPPTCQWKGCKDAQGSKCYSKCYSKCFVQQGRKAMEAHRGNGSRCRCRRCEVVVQGNRGVVARNLRHILVWLKQYKRARKQLRNVRFEPVYVYTFGARKQVWDGFAPVSVRFCVVETVQTDSETRNQLHAPATTPHAVDHDRGVPIDSYGTSSRKRANCKLQTVSAMRIP